MKKNSLLLLFGLMLITAFFAACSSDDDSDEPTNNRPDNLAAQWTKIAGHDYNLLVSTMEDYLTSAYSERGLWFNNYNKYSVQDGRSGQEAKSPIVSFSEPMLLISVHTYHYFLSNHSNGSSVIKKGITSWLEDADGKKYAVPAYNHWCYGQGQVTGSCWNSFPFAVVPAGNYLVKCSNPASWSYNSSSKGRGFAVVHAVHLDR